MTNIFRDGTKVCAISENNFIFLLSLALLIVYMLRKEDFKILFDKHFEDVRRYVFYRSGNEELASDIAQETFLRIWDKQININPETVKGLLYKIANDLFVSHYRHQKVEYNFFNNFEPNNRSLTPEDEMNFQELIKEYEKALKTMPEKQRTVFLMNRIDELKYKEIANRLGLSVKAIEKRMSLALDHLKQNLKSSITGFVLFIICNKLFGTKQKDIG